MQDEATLRARLRAPRAGAVAGIVFSVLFLISLMLIRLSIPANPDDAGIWLSDRGESVRLALNLLPFAGIAFLWFIGVLRDRMGELEDRFFATVFLGSGILFLAMLFAAAAVAGALLISYEALGGALIESGIYTFARSVAYETISVYATKMAGVFMISTCTLAIRIAIFPRWMAYLGYALAMVMLVGSGVVYWAPMLFPMWSLVISVQVLAANLRTEVA